MENENPKSDQSIFGIHHVTAITKNPQANVDFYTDIVGLRLVKLTVNQDDPTSYHLYYGDGIGRPGTILTFFHWPGSPLGQRGTSEVSATSFLIPKDSLEFWINHLKNKKVKYEGPIIRFGKEEEVIKLHDPDGLELELVAHESAKKREINIWKGGNIPEKHAVRGFYSVTLSEEGYEQTSSVLTDELGFVPTRQEGSRFRFEIPKSSSPIDGKDNLIDGARIVDVLCLPYSREAFIGIGSVHHVAWRTPTDEQQKQLRYKIIQTGLNATPVIDRFYFHSVYFREPGGILFEIATNPPGFMVDEKEEELGTHLSLPPWFESVRADLEKVLPQVKLNDKTIGGRKQ